MDISNLEAKLSEIERKASYDKMIAIKEYCLSKNSVNVGDVFTDHIGSILVQKIRFSKSGDGYCCVYFGKELTKKMMPKKSGAARWAWQTNEVKS